MEEFVICAICQHQAKNLTIHLKREHRMSTKVYKNRYNLPVISCDILEKRKKTSLDRYGEEYYTNREGANFSYQEYEGGHPFKDKKIRDKCIETKKKKYNDANFNNREKARETTLNKYGVEYTGSIPEVIEKRKKTLIERYGKIFNNDTPYNKKEVPQDFKDKFESGVSISELSNIYGVSEPVVHRWIVENDYKRDTVLRSENNFCTDYEVIKDFLKECLTHKKVLSFYEYGKIKGSKYTLKLKRLFNKGKKYSYLRDKLFEIALKEEEHRLFLNNINQTININKSPSNEINTYKVKIENISGVNPKLYRSSNDISEKKNMEDIVLSYCMNRDFPYMNYTNNKLTKLFESYKKISVICKNDTIIQNACGVQLCESFFPNIYSCKRKGQNKPPVEYWDDDEFLRNFVKNRLKYSDIITDSTLRTGIKLSKICISNFKPSIAHFLYSKYAINKNILDYSCGFGSRMLAAMSQDLDYYGYEPAVLTYNNLNKFGNFLEERTEAKFHIKNSGSEDSIFYENFFGFAFSSPPYFDYEIYSEDEKQSIKRYPRYEDWCEMYWHKTISNIYQSLIPGGYFGVCLSPTLMKDLINKTYIYAEKLGFIFEKEYKAQFKQVLSSGEKFEKVLIFQKHL